MHVQDAMQYTFERIEPTATVHEAAQQMVAHAVDLLVVMRGEQLVGVIGLRDLYTAPMSSDDNVRIVVQRTEQEMADLWHRQSVAQIMAQPIWRVSATDELMHAATLLVNGDRHYLPVVREGQVVGVIGRADIARRLLTLGTVEPKP